MNRSRSIQRGHSGINVIEGMLRSLPCPHRLNRLTGIIHSRASQERRHFRFFRDEICTSKAFGIRQQYQI
ncbi:MAG: hypothetical protein MUF49_00020 [Oculatellaceae cyanobacterium Prado106]|nr:hypothetical protein [Oculatellaceae cyanobacterium Prado106]